jgi:YcaO-like protein with predicted kinase domain
MTSHDVPTASDTLAAKTFYRGTHRLIPPRETVDRVWPLMDAMGITRVANVTNLDVIGVPVVMVVRPNSRTNCVSQGKGLDLDSAKASGLMESAESFHAERIQLPLELASYEEFRRGHCTVDIRMLPPAKNRRFHKRLKLLWIEGWDLFQNESVWLPYEVAHLNFCLPFPEGSGCFYRSSNGLASGNHILEAISHGLCEIVERDSTALWELLDRGAQARTRLDLDSVDDPACRDIVEKYERAGIFVAAWVITSDVGIPAFRCSIFPRETRTMHSMHPAGGYGCHPDRGVALVRALTEAAQSRLTLIAGSRDDLERGHYDPRRIAEYLRGEEALLKSKACMNRFSDIATWNSKSFDSDVAWELERLRKTGIERVIVVDLTRPEFRLPVVRVVIPGMELSGTLPGRRARAFRRARS